MICALGCSGEPGADLPEFYDVSTAPQIIRSAAQAVVRIGTARERGTGSFISPTGLLLTNNHVLGDTVCPVEGCFVELTFEHQRGEARQQPIVGFAVPVAVDVGLDMAVVQIYTGTGAAGMMLSTPAYLSFAAQDAAALMGTRITVVGHPGGNLKKWTTGVVVRTVGDWFVTTAYALPGDSGSPALDDEGHLVGVIHRGSSGPDLFTNTGANVSSIGTPAALIQVAMAAPLPGAVVSVEANTTVDNVLENDLVYLNARAANASVDGTPVGILSLLAQACDTALARRDFKSPDDLAAALRACYHATTWIECRTDASPSSYGGSCPTPTDATVWDTRFQAMNQRWLDMNGQLDLYPIAFGVAHLATSLEAGLATGAQSLRTALDSAQPTLDFALANYLVAFAIDTYSGVNIAAYVANYRQTLHYELSASSVASAAGWLLNRRLSSRAAVIGILNQLHDDPAVSVGAKLYIEDLMYSMDAF